MAAIPDTLHDSSYDTMDGSRQPASQTTFFQESSASTINPDLRECQEFSIVNQIDEVQSADRRLQKRSFLQVLNDWWAWEIAGVILSLLCLSANIAILIKIDGESLSAWEFPITPNAMISIFSTLSKVSLVTALTSCVSQLKWSYFQGRSRSLSHLQHFEDASRGPWGSLVFLYSIKAAARLTSFGALLIILAMAIEPFAQQVIELPIRSSPLAGIIAGISNVQYYSSEWDRGASFSPAMLGAISAGIFGLGHAPQVNCSTGTCDFPVFKSLGIRSKCINVTNTTIVSCNQPNGSMPFCNFSTPGGINIYMMADQDDSELSGSNKPSAFTYTNLRVVPGPDSQNITAGIQFPLSAFARLKFMEVPVLLPGPLPEYDITECAFYMCEKTYENAKVKGGMVAIDPSPDKDRQLYQTAWYDPDSWNYLSFNATEDRRISSPGFNAGSAVSGTLAIPADNPHLPPAPPGRSFSYAAFAKEYTDLGTGLSAIFNVTGIDHVMIYFYPTFNLLAGPLWNTSDLNALVTNVSTSLTNYIRAASHNREVLAGTAYVPQTFVHVRWWWLVLQVAAINMGIGVLVLTVLYTTRSRALLWKSSSLALLLQGIDAELDQDSRAFRERWAEMTSEKKLSQMEMLSRGYVLRFEPGRMEDDGQDDLDGRYDGDVARFVVQEKGMT